MATPEGRIEPAEVLAAVARIDTARSHGWSVLSNERPDFDTVLEYARQAGQHPTGSGEKGGPTCTHCGRPFSPDHDVTAGGPTVRHPFTPPTDRPRQVGT